MYWDVLTQQLSGIMQASAYRVVPTQQLSGTVQASVVLAQRVCVLTLRVVFVLMYCRCGRERAHGSSSATCIAGGQAEVGVIRYMDGHGTHNKLQCP